MNADLTLFWELEGSSVSKKQADLLTVYITKDKKNYPNRCIKYLWLNVEKGLGME